MPVPKKGAVPILQVAGGHFGGYGARTRESLARRRLGLWPRPFTAATGGMAGTAGGLPQVDGIDREIRNR